MNPNRRQFLKLAVGAVMAQAVDPLATSFEPWYVRAAKPDWRPSPIDKNTYLQAFTSFVQGSSSHISYLRRRTEGGRCRTEVQSEGLHQ